MDRDDRTNRRPWMRLASSGIELAAAVGGFAIVGHLIDRSRDSHPKGLLIGALLGLVGGMYNLIKAALAEGRRAGTIDRAGSRGQDAGEKR